ncbi:hypothetical protein AK964_05065 [Clostridium butyricum]|nr:hypothetical protein AK964_05065 [Clostridium butyricum]
MKRVGIITLNGYFNYGNRLQNYALQHAIEMLNFECETILNDTYILKQNNKNNSKVDKIKYFLKKDFLSQLITINEKINKKRIQK